MMTKLTALIPILILGSSSVALADHDAFDRAPVPTYERAPRGPLLRYPDDDAWRPGPVGARWARPGERAPYGDVGPRRYRSHWVPLGTAALGAGRAIIDVDPRGTFTQLRIQVERGRAYLDRVVVRFRDGSRQVVDVDRVLDRDDRWIQFELDGFNRRVDAVALVGTTRRGGALQVFGI